MPIPLYCVCGHDVRDHHPDQGDCGLCKCDQFLMGSQTASRLIQAKAEVLSRMSGCPDPGCYACKANRDAVEELVAAAKAEVQP